MHRLTASVPAAIAFCLLALIRPGAQTGSSGLDTSSFDRSVRPQDDLYRYANGRWIDRTSIPEDRVNYGAFAEIADRTEADLRTIIEQAAARRPRAGTPLRLVVDLYASVMDEARIEALGASAIAPELHKIDAIATPKAMAAEAGYLSAIGTGGPFGGTVGSDPLNPGGPVVRVTQGGTLLPDRDYYLKQSDEMAALRRRYVEYLTRVFTLTGRAAPAADAERVLDLETRLAAAQWPQATSRDPDATYTRFTLRQLGREMPGFDWEAWAEPQGIDRSPAIILAQPSFFKAFAALVPQTPLPTLKAWLAARYITAAATFLSRAFVDARFEFFGRVLTGQEQPRARWRRAVSLVNGYLGDAIGQEYVRQRFPSSIRTRAEKLVMAIVDAYRRAVAQSDWLSGSARREALKKLSSLKVRVGYPDAWRSYTGLVIKPDDLAGNVQRAMKFENDYRMSRLLSPGGEDEWPVPPQTINASYSAGANQILLPAAMLQPPIFNPAADDAVNFGAIGAIAGHEIGHALDRRGRQYDGAGAVRDWWSAEDEQRFTSRVQGLLRQAGSYSPGEGLRVDGLLTLDENAGDLAGLSVAWAAYSATLGKNAAPLIDGLTAAQRFLLAWAQIWRWKERPDYLRQQLLSSPYAPAPFRANGTVSNLEVFYQAFEVTPGDRLYRPPADRVRIW